MIKINEKIAVSIDSLGENSAYQYGLVVAPFDMEGTGLDRYYCDKYGNAVFFDEWEFGHEYAVRNSLVLLPFTLLKALYECEEGEYGWTDADDTPFSNTFDGTEASVA